MQTAGNTVSETDPPHPRGGAGGVPSRQVTLGMAHAGPRPAGATSDTAGSNRLDNLVEQCDHPKWRVSVEPSTDVRHENFSGSGNC
jgi:hypothetical protein